MSEPVTITAKLPAWLFTAVWSVDDLQHMIQKGELQRAIESLSFRADHLDDTPGRYTNVGEATITVVLHSQDRLVAGQIADLQAALTQERAASVKRQNAILERISKLQALTFEASADPFDSALTEAYANGRADEREAIEKERAL